jgi:hypothetical protein
MEQIPKVVRQRLQTTAEAGVHPDANVLAGFVEKSLNERERAEVLGHLGRCVDCRDIVLRASPELVSAPISVGLVRSSWLRGPVLRWGALAACLVVVSAAVMLRREHPVSTETSIEAVSSRPPAVAAENKAAETAAAQAPSQERAAAKGAFPLPQASRRELPLTSPGKNQLARSDGSKGRVIAGTRAAARPDENATAPVPSPPELENRASRYQKKQVQQDQTVELGAEAANLDAEAPTVAPGTETVTFQAEAGQLTTLQDTMTGRAKDAKEPQPKSGAGAALSRNVPAAPPAKADYKVSAQIASNVVQLRNPMTTTPRWTLSPDGVLERSLDSGRTWETIPVAASAALRALAADGFEIWVGGAAGALYHSSDIGQHWVRVIPTVDGKALDADIIGVAFTDASNGKLTTSNHETWTTSDAGQSWQKK